MRTLESRVFSVDFLSIVEFFIFKMLQSEIGLILEVGLDAQKFLQKGGGCISDRASGGREKDFGYHAGIY